MTTSDQERCFALVKRLYGYGLFSTGRSEHGQHVIVIPHWSFDRLEEFMDRDRFSDEYDPEPDYDRPSSNAEAMADEAGMPEADPVWMASEERQELLSNIEWRTATDNQDAWDEEPEGAIPPNTEKEQTVSDPTESARREMIESSQPAADLAEDIGPHWDTTNLQRDFSVIGFAAPFVVVRRKSDGQKGTLEFTHSPRVYFNFEPTS